MASQTCQVEVWVLVDADGDYGVGREADAASQNYADDVGGTEGNRRMVKLTLTIPLPKPMELVATIPEEEPGEAELKVEAA
jgi:hypothetical protein